MRARLAILIALGLAAPALAADPQGAKLTVAGVPCAALGVSAGAGADYVPGVDANGSAVAPADLPRAASPVAADAVTVEIDQHLAGQFGIPATGGAYRGKPIVGYVTVRDGSAYFNGQKLNADANDALAAACRAEKK